MGGGDLNLKKSWHPATFRNQERVWKEERKAADEEKKLQQLRKELEEERQIQELQRIQEQAGGKKRNDRLDWMYQAAPTAGAKDEKDLEDYLLGKKRVDDILSKKDAGLKALSRDSDSFMNNASKANSVRDIQAKVREDPLLAIKKREQASMEALMKNPIKMRQLRESKEPKKDKKDKKKSKKHKEDKADREERRKERSERKSSSSSKRRRSSSRDRRSDVSDSRSRSRSPRPLKRSRSGSRSISPQRSSTRPRSPAYGRHNHREKERAAPLPPTQKKRQEDHHDPEAEERRKAEIAEERARRLKAMTDDANAEELARKARLAQISEMERKEEAEDEAKRSKASSRDGQAGFLKSAQKSAYSDMTLADRVQRSRATLQRR
ncbi:RNA-splicing factor [Haplosporangium sp. Z 767]|nr:RNA-splicing factor [Haplosporangium sp. Z 767]